MVCGSRLKGIFDHVVDVVVKVSHFSTERSRDSQHQIVRLWFVCSVIGLHASEEDLALKLISFDRHSHLAK